MPINGFEKIDANNVEEFNKAANQKASLGEHSSPFQEGATFTVVGYEFHRSKTNPDRIGVVALLKGETGNNEELWLTTLLKKGVDTQMKVVENSSTIAKKLVEKLTSNTTNKELGDAFVQIVGQSKIKVVRIQYARITKYGNTIPSSLVGFEFV